MLRVGLTGGIGCGKSTAVAMFAELGAPVIEADPIAHQMIEPGQPAYNDVVREFGGSVLDSGGRINRRKLGEIVFADSARLARLNQIVHPRVIAETEARLGQLERSSSQPFVIVEAALLIEAGYWKRMNWLVVVWCRPELQRERLRARGMTPEEIERRIAAQMSQEEKLRLADDEIDSSGPLEETRRQVARLAAKLERLASVGQEAWKKKQP